MKILVTGGPVHAKLDAVKFISNRFKGGRIAELAVDLSKHSGNQVVYLCVKDSVQPTNAVEFDDFLNPTDMRVSVVYHDGFDDYRQKVKEMAPEFDAIILGAAVANLIPVCYYGKPEMVGAANSAPTLGERIPLPLTGKFPSHNYKVGDRIFMEWTIAPRVIEEVKPFMKKGAHLFGFKLLEGVPQEELIDAAYEVLTASGCTAVIANDAKTGLSNKLIVTKERAVHPVHQRMLADWLMDAVTDKYYSTEPFSGSLNSCDGINLAWEKAESLIAEHRQDFVEVRGGYRFGTVAVRIGESESFVTTERGKKEDARLVVVKSVDHGSMIVTTMTNCTGREMKATLNAPLLHRIFFRNRKVDHIVHLHRQEDSLPTLPYAPPGTVRDTWGSFDDNPASKIRPNIETSFNVADHGCYLLFDKEGKTL